MAKKKVIYSEPADYFPESVRKELKIGEYAEERKLRKNNRHDKIWWVDEPDKDGGMDFTFDKVTFFNAFQDYPHKLTPEQKEIFDKENPFWADFFKDRT